MRMEAKLKKSKSDKIKEETGMEVIDLADLESELKSEEEPDDKEKIARRRKWNFYFELALFFILGILVGVAFKTEASKKITIGFDDNKMQSVREDYNINQLQADLIKKQVAADQASQNNSTGQVDGNPDESQTENSANTNNSNNQDANQ